MGKPATSRTVIPSDLSQIPRVTDPILEKAEDAGFDKDALFAIRLALDEAVTNAIRHGNQSDPGKKVTVDYAVTPDRVWIQVADEGPGFSPDQLPDPTAQENLTRPHGRGVMLIRAYMTEVAFAERGRCLTMIKTRDCRKPQA